ncbi:VanZ family protein [Paenibacillus sp. L3-i20]|uniref:VanZ family protein n=1 Tax=Paenibacillus sp. L3-i20 TaxID=2905833 RepID=UPI001EDEE0BE|nr:VanZ family protein [Paenibacillus sp. L3-i20]GKU77207.1 hypothetical protein L3i20_v216040 [Paenibacillus sp. L3-i20]
MGIDEIYNNLHSLMLPVIVIIGIEFVLIGLYFFLYYRNRQSEGKPRTGMKKLFLGALFIGYVVFVLQLTMFGRGNSHFLEMSLHPFSSYIEAWNKYSLRDLQNCIFNIIMFIPMGILLPLISRKCNAFKWLLLIVVSSTLFIETYQTLSGSGLFELDDIINNTLGGILGYQLYRLVSSIVHNKKVRMKSLRGNLAILEWATQMKELLQESWRLAKFARQDGTKLPEDVIETMKVRYDGILEHGKNEWEKDPVRAKIGPRGRKVKSKAANLGMRFLTHKESILRFLWDANIPFDNN